MRESVFQVPIARHVLETTAAFRDVLEATYAGISRPDIGQLFDRLSSASTYEEFAELVKTAEGSAGLMRFMQLDLHDAVTWATGGAVARRLVRVIAGSPVTMAQMTRYLGDGGSYAPVTILIEETPDATRVADEPVPSALAIYPGGEAAMLTAQALDAEVFALFKRATAA
jgi:hypothetical protein